MAFGRVAANEASFVRAWHHDHVVVEGELGEHGVFGQRVSILVRGVRR